MELTNQTQATLTKRQQLWYNIMRSNSGVLHILGKPGMAKSSQIETIAHKLGYAFIDLRLSMLDETDVGLYPVRTQVQIGNETIETFDYAVPFWAIMANQKPTIVLFDELKRASLSVRNAALQILLERRIGPVFKFNQNVHFVVADNLGEEDDTDVEEFDAALNNRLIHIKYELTLQEWIDDFAKQNVHPSIVAFLQKHPEYFWHKGKSAWDKLAYATPRSWTFLSNFIKTNMPNGASYKEILEFVSPVIVSYVGSAGVHYVEFLRNTNELSFEEFIELSKSEVKKVVKNLARSQRAQFFEKAKDYGWPNELDKMSDKQIANMALLVGSSHTDETFESVVQILKNISAPKNTVFIKELKKEYPETYEVLKNSAYKISK